MKKCPACGMNVAKHSYHLHIQQQTEKHAKIMKWTGVRRFTEQPM